MAADDQKRTVAQNKRIFALGAKHGFGVEELRDLAESWFKTRSLSSLTFDQANYLIKKLGGIPFHGRTEATPRRTEQDRRQKAGVKVLVSPTHLDHLRRLWRQKSHRTEEGLAALCRRIFGADKPRTTAECSKAIEAVKSMNARSVKEAA